MSKYTAKFSKLDVENGKGDLNRGNKKSNDKISYPLYENQRLSHLKETIGV